MSDYVPAAASHFTKDSIQDFAEHIANELGYRFNGQVHDFIESMGGRILVKDILLSDPKSTGSLFVDGDDDFRIIVPAHTSLKRDAFTIAHEFGHYVVHYLIPKAANDDFPEKICAYRKGSNRIEWEANWFAAAFLMPRALFAERFSANQGDLAATADEFGVSYKAAEVRAKDLGL